MLAKFLQTGAKAYLDTCCVKAPFEWKYDEGAWNLEFENVSKRLHYAGVRAFAGLSKAE